MCLILISWQQHPEHPLVVAANRDEFFARPTAAADFWPHAPHIFAGRDLEHGGSWLGLSRGGRFAAVTNLRLESHPGQQSRGRLVSDFLDQTGSAVDFFEKLELSKQHYRPFNFIASDGKQLLYTHNQRPGWSILQPGIQVLANVPNDSPSGKREKGVEDLRRGLADGRPSPETLLSLLRDRSISEPNREPLYRELSRRFVSHGEYGTRSSSVLIQQGQQAVAFWEQNYDGEQQPLPLRQHWIELRSEASQ